LLLNFFKNKREIGIKMHFHPWRNLNEQNWNENTLPSIEELKRRMLE
jgi:hypothetical protein